MATEGEVRGRLTLLGALLRAVVDGRPSRLEVEEWERILAPLVLRERQVVAWVFVAGMSDAEVARHWGLTRTRVWQIKQSGLDRLRRAGVKLDVKPGD